MCIRDRGDALLPEKRGLLIAPFSAKTTYGTGCFIMLNTGDRPHDSANNLLATVAWQLGGTTTYALEGSVFVGGSVIQWLRDG